MRERLTYVNLQAGLEAHLAARRIWPLLFLLGLILYVWTRYFLLGVPLLLLRGVLEPKIPVEFFFCLILGSFFLLFFLGLAAPILYEIGFQLFGQEVVRVEGGWLSIQKRLFGMGKSRRFPTAEISQMGLLERTLAAELGRMEIRRGPAQAQRLSLGQLSSRQRWIGWLQRLGFKGILFRQGGSPHWFAGGLSSQEAGELLTRLKFYLPEGAFAQEGPEETSAGGES